MRRIPGATTRETVKFWQAHDLEQLELLRATYVTHSFARHAHDGFAIGVIEAGAEQFYYRGVTHIAPTGAVIVINPGETHTGQAAARSGWVYRMLYPDTTLLRRVASGVAGYSHGIPHFPAPVIHDGQLSAALRRLHLTLETSSSALERQSRLLATLALLVARYADSSRVEQVVRCEQTGVRQARQYLDAYYNENVSLNDLARLAGLSPFHLSRVFAREVGLPPHTYLTGVRVDHAKRLLLAGHPAAVAARETGFVDQSHLTRHFKRIVGVTPGQYMRDF
jgi:AraC-like DNA-binding protein